MRDWTQDLREPDGTSSQRVKGEGTTPVGREEVPQGEDQELDGTHLQREQQGWDGQQDAEAEGGDGQTQIALCWHR